MSARRTIFVAYFHRAMSADLPYAVADARPIGCPKCRVPLTFHRSVDPVFDACGFETYSFECKACGAPLTGIIDPFDDLLLVSETSVREFRAEVSP